MVRLPALATVRKIFSRAKSQAGVTVLVIVKRATPIDGSPDSTLLPAGIGLANRGPALALDRKNRTLTSKFTA